MLSRYTLLLTLLLLAGNTVHAGQPGSPCTINKNAPAANTWHWPTGTHVKVYFERGMFTTDEQQAILEVAAQWNQWSEQIGTGIRYEHAGEIGSIIDGKGYLTLTRGAVKKTSGGKHNACFYAYPDEKGLVRSAWITFDVKTKDLAALKSYVAHELAHGMGLQDCLSCQDKSTIMSGFSGGVNKGNGLMAPSQCDLEVVKTLFD